jgi:cytochrome P450
MVREQDTSGQFTDDELIAHLVLLLIAGSQTPSDLISNALKLALHQPDVATKLAMEPGLAAPFITETLRFDPPVHALTRVATSDIELYGTRIKAGSRLLLFIGAANRDPRRFTEPERFDINRPDNQPLAFGLGQHFCLGAAFARMEGEVAVPMFLRAFPHSAIASAPSYRDQLVQRGISEFRVMLNG